MKKTITLIMLALSAAACIAQSTQKVSTAQSNVAVVSQSTQGDHPIGRISNDTLYLENTEIGRAVFSIWKDTPVDEMRKYFPKDQTLPKFISLCKDGLEAVDGVVDTIRYE
jgi:hypothetical protein